jgi:tRNA pseudouridine38-40 synthase
MKKSTVRTLYSVDICQEPGSSLVTISFTGNGFLQNMVRILTGTLIEIGLGERDWREADGILNAKDRQAAGFTAPAEGLCLVRVIYEGIK